MFLKTTPTQSSTSLTSPSRYRATSKPCKLSAFGLPDMYHGFLICIMDTLCKA